MRIGDEWAMRFVFRRTEEVREMAHYLREIKDGGHRGAKPKMYSSWRRTASKHTV